MKTVRLESLDVLRGFNLFCLVALESIIDPLAEAIQQPWFAPILSNFRHAEWFGLTPWDLVMPLFMFMAGVSIPYALARYTDGSESKSLAYRRIARRFVLLWILGMACQGNLLSLNPDRIYFYSNTLQAIATGYLVAAILFLNTNWRTQLFVALGLLAVYWVGLELFVINGFGAGSYTPESNFAEGLDRAVLGRFRDFAITKDGVCIFADSYRYTWIWSSLNFAVTVITGMLAGHIVKNASQRAHQPNSSVALRLLMIGILLIIVGYLWSGWHPVIKKIWTGSMALITSGWCFSLLAVFYYIIDCKKWWQNNAFFKVYGMNSIAAYVLTMCISFNCVSNSLLHGFERWLGEYYPVAIALGNVSIIYAILYCMYRNKIFIKC